MKWLQFQLIVKYAAVTFTCLLFLYFIYSTKNLAVNEYNVETKWLPVLHLGVTCMRIAVDQVQD